MTKETLLRIVSRRSPLALMQANIFTKALREKLPAATTAIKKISTLGDRNRHQPLRDIGGKSLFVKELETALLDGEADVAAHSLKDLPGQLPRGLIIGAVLPRGDAMDAFVSNRYDCLEDLPTGASIGTSSLRRQVQLLNKRPDLVVVNIRGNLQTRIERLDNGEVDAIILACAGLRRLGYEDRIQQRLGSELMVPAIGQGTIALECRAGDKFCREALASVNDEKTWLCVAAERKVGQSLLADCFSPLGAYVSSVASGFKLQVCVGNAMTNELLSCEREASFERLDVSAKTIAQILLAKGARRFLDARS